MNSSFVIGSVLHFQSCRVGERREEGDWYRNGRLEAAMACASAIRGQGERSAHTSPRSMPSAFRNMGVYAGHLIPGPSPPQVSSPGAGPMPTRCSGSIGTWG